ncbi:unnamed protein product [Thelazia callipaeda]|uniref:LITAF domain-containing protein n=1 Tax=Thelazia callipaeda TaxID=103827 RepID=A0A0N5CMF3_THECL|nr:unnamed protein product [Thelazia callipaeda]
MLKKTLAGIFSDHCHGLSEDEAVKTSTAELGVGRRVSGYDPASESVMQKIRSTFVIPHSSMTHSGISDLNGSFVSENGTIPIVTKQTQRKLFVVDDKHLFQLFKRCPICGNMMKSIVISSHCAVPMVTYKCQGDCDENVWIGHETE